jgi:beta-glucanase (GH16 family)
MRALIRALAILLFTFNPCGLAQRLAWEETFNGPKGKTPDRSKWSYDLGNGSDGWGNRELEFYQDGSDVAALDGRGHLAIRAIKRDGKFLSARIKTLGKFELKYGRVEARIKIPSGQGLWPAFWMLGSDIEKSGWPNCGEIDIMENIGREPRTAHGTVHGPGYAGGKAITSQVSLRTGEPLSARFHIFGVEWSPQALRFYLDHQEYFRVEHSNLPVGSTWVFDHPFFLILNVAVGGAWPGNPDASTIFPQTMLVDWVRVFQPPLVSSGRSATTSR